MQAGGGGDHRGVNLIGQTGIIVAGFGVTFRRYSRTIGAYDGGISSGAVCMAPPQERLLAPFFLRGGPKSPKPPLALCRWMVYT